MSETSVDPSSGASPALPMDDALLDLPFDHYERHAITRAVADSLRDFTSRRSLRVVDVGGAASSLALFLPSDEVVAIDLDRSSGGEYVQGSGVELPFRDGAFNLASCHDTLEHVPAPLRGRFIDEMVRVATDAVVVQGPFNEPGVPEAERIVMKIASDLYGADCSTVKFLTEHAECGLPDLRETVKQLGNAGFHSIVVPNGALDEWIVKMLVKHHASKLAPLGLTANEFDRWSNRTFAPGIDKRPTYRYAIVAVRASEDRLLRLLEEAFRLPPHHSDEDAVTLPLSAVRPSVAKFANMAHDRLVELTDELKAIPLLREEQARLENVVRARNETLAELNERLRRQDEEIIDLTMRLNAIYSSTGYRILRAYRQVTNTLFPPGSLRGAPYRMTMGAVRKVFRLGKRGVSVAARGNRARERYGTKAVITRSVQKVRAAKAVDPIKYALAVDWHGAVPPERARQRKDGEPLTINWLVPTVGEGGGLRTIFRFVEYFAKQGYKQRLYEMPIGRPMRAKPDELREEVRRLFGIELDEVSLDFENMADADAIFATSWHTAYPVLKHTGAGRKFYFVQDFEPFFAPVGTESALAENTYRFGFHGVTAGPWLASKLSADYGMRCDAFNLAVDPLVYYPKEVPSRQRVFYYARPATPRRGFELGMHTLDVFHKRHPEFEIVLAGGEIPHGAWNFPLSNRGYLSETQLNDLYNQCAAALVISLTNCSLLPLEIMAAGCPVVSNDGPNNEMLLPDDSAVYAAPAAYALAEALERAVGITDRERLVGLARAYRWDDQFARVEQIVLDAVGAATPV